MCHTWDSSAHLAPANHLHLVARLFKQRSILVRVFVLHAWLSSVVFATDSLVWTSSSLNLFCLFLRQLPDLAFGLFLILIVPGWYFFQRVTTLDINSCSGFSCELPHWIIRLVNHFDFIWTDRTGLLWECFVSFSLRSEICFFKWSLYSVHSVNVCYIWVQSPNPDSRCRCVVRRFSENKHLRLAALHVNQLANVIKRMDHRQAHFFLDWPAIDQHYRRSIVINALGSPC